jgi:hypothetical protein
MAKYRKKSVVVEAFQPNPEDLFDSKCWPDWMHIAYNKGIVVRAYLALSHSRMVITTLEGNHLVSPGDFIIQDVAGELYPCKPDIFERTYSEVVPNTDVRTRSMLRFLKNLDTSLPPVPMVADIDDPETDRPCWTGKFYDANEDAIALYDSPKKEAEFAQAFVDLRNSIPALIEMLGGE